MKPSLQWNFKLRIIDCPTEVSLRKYMPLMFLGIQAFLWIRQTQSARVRKISLLGPVACTTGPPHFYVHVENNTFQWNVIRVMWCFPKGFPQPSPLTSQTFKERHKWLETMSF
jgi:hypothetical protein